MSVSLPCEVEASTAGFSHDQSSLIDSRNARASSAVSNSNTGARCTPPFCTTLTPTPPDSFMTFMPRDVEATSVPSVVAIGMKKVP